MKYLAVIPARSGSKGLKNKNILPLGGIPLAAWTIRAALDAKVFSEVHFSTDSTKYADIAVEYGASAPFLRPDELASDAADSWSVVKFVLNKYHELGKDFDAVMILQPTVPFRSADDIRNAVRLLEERGAEAVVSVTEADHAVYWSAELPPDGDMRIFHERIQYIVQRQKLPKQYLLNGAIYLTKVDHLFNSTDIYERGCLAYVMPKERSRDIDTLEDLEWCEFLLTRRNGGK